MGKNVKTSMDMFVFKAFIVIMCHMIKLAENVPQIDFDKVIILERMD